MSLITSVPQFIRRLTLGGALVVAMTATAWSQTPASIFDEEPPSLTSPRIPDRIEGFNRTMFRFNDGLYRYTLRPLSKGYAKVVPRKLRSGINSFFHNLAFPTRFVGNVLEGELDGAAVETGRFVVNTVTTLGFARTADRFPALKERPSDLGLAFGRWGIGHGTYLILPLLGPTSVRDGVGQGLSGYFLDPVHYLQEWEYRTAGNVLRVVNQSPELMDNYDMLKSAAIDPYVALRDAYSARRLFRAEASMQGPASPVEAATPATP
jgi:phospholipid-binding lipoprotein MlaA